MYGAFLDMAEIELHADLARACNDKIHNAHLQRMHIPDLRSQTPVSYVL